MAEFLVLFLRFPQGKENRTFPQFQSVFRKSISNRKQVCFGYLLDKGFVLAKRAYMNSMNICGTLIKIIQISWKHHLQKRKGNYS